MQDEMGRPDPLVSIIIPMYNAEDYVSDAIRSVLNQSHTNWELILVDDGSTDQTKKVVSPFLADIKIKYLYQKNGGQGSARNRGIEEAKGSYLAFLDADDFWDDNKLQSQLNIMQEENTSLVFSKLRRVTSDGKDLNKSVGSGAGIYKGFTTLFLMAGGNITIPNSSVLIKKESVDEVGNFDESDEIRNIEDYELWFRMLMSGCEFYGINKALGAYRMHENQTTHNEPGSSRKIIAYLEMLCTEYPAKKVFIKFLIFQRLSTYYEQQENKQKAKAICLRIYYSNTCINSYWAEKYLIDLVGFNAYLRFRRLLIRRFRRFKTFVESIDE